MILTDSEWLCRLLLYLHEIKSGSALLGILFDKYPWLSHLIEGYTCRSENVTKCKKKINKTGFNTSFFQQNPFKIWETNTNWKLVEKEIDRWINNKLFPLKQRIRDSLATRHTIQPQLSFTNAFISWSFKLQRPESPLNEKQKNKMSIREKQKLFDY